MQEQELCVRLLPLFATLLDYPGPWIGQTARECARLAASVSPEASDALGGFCESLATTPSGELEEAYAGTFELNAAVHPYVGYHLFGETYQRSVFLLSLGERYRAANFEPGKELADHLPVMLRFVACCPDPRMVDELVAEGLLPALDKMIRQSPESEDGEIDSPGGDKAVDYQQVLQALRLVLQRLHGFKVENAD